MLSLTVVLAIVALILVLVGQTSPRALQFHMAAIILLALALLFLGIGTPLRFPR
jgi:hypothetical protein